MEKAKRDLKKCYLIVHDIGKFSEFDASLRYYVSLKAVLVEFSNYVGAEVFEMLYDEKQPFLPDGPCIKL